MSRQPSASYTGLLLACPAPFNPELEDEPDLPGEPARYGSAFHQVIAACLRADMTGRKPLEKTPGAYAKAVDKAAAAYDVKTAAAELAGHVKSSVGVLRHWLAREKLEVREIETAYAIRLGDRGDRGPTWGARPISPHDENHHYDVDPCEIPGTVDLIAYNDDQRLAVVIDHKTGSYGDSAVFARPSKIPQMRTLGLAVRGEEVDTGVGIFHADRRGLPVIYSEPYEIPEQRAHAADLNAALALVGSGFIRPGAHCGHCPVRMTCPAHRADLLAESSVALMRSANAIAVEPITGPLVPSGATNLAVEDRAALLYGLLQKFKVLEKAGRDEIRRLVRGGAVIETVEGKTLVIREQTFETLSKKSVLEALGKVAGEKMIAKLRKAGAVRESTREMLVGEK